MTLQEALDECSICGLFRKEVSDEHKFQVIDKIMSTPSTKVPKVKLCYIINWLLKKVEWQKQQNEKMKCCANCEKYFADCEMEDMAEKEYLEANAYCKHWKLKE